MMGVYAQPPSAIQASIRPDEGIMVEKMNVWDDFLGSIDGHWAQDHQQVDWYPSGGK